MKSKKLRTLFIMLTAALVLTGVNYTIGDNNHITAYASEVNEGEISQTDVTEKDVEEESEGKVDIKISYNNQSAENSIEPVITVTNTSDEEMNLADLNLKYYYPSNSEANEVFACYYAGTVDGNYRSLTANVEGTIEKFENTEVTAEKYANITFNGGTLDEGQTMTIQISVHKEDWTNYEVTDKSLCSINAYMDGQLVYGKDDSTTQPEEEVIKDSELSETDIGYILGFDNDIEVRVKLNGNKFLGINNSKAKKDIELTEGKDYIIKYDQSKDDYLVTIKKDFLENSRDDIRELRFNFSAGNPQDLEIVNIYVAMPWGQMLGISHTEGNYDDILEVPTYLDGGNEVLNFYDCTFEYRYSPDKVKVVDVKPGEIVQKYNDFEYTVDDIKGQVKVRCKSKDLDDILNGKIKVFPDFYNQDEPLELCRLSFENINGTEGTKSKVWGYGEITGVSSSTGEVTTTDLYGITGKVKFNKFNPYADLVLPELSKETLRYQPEVAGDSCSIDITLNGNEFEGVEGLEEGKDYTFEGNTLTLNKEPLEKYKDEYEHDFCINFSNEIKKTLTVINSYVFVPEHFDVNMGDSDAERDRIIMVPIDISHNVGDVLTQCDFDLKYDTDIFEDAYIVCDDKNLQSEADTKTGIVKVSYDKHDETLSGAESFDEASGTQLKMNLALKVRSDAPFGETKVIFDSNKFIARNDIDYAADVSRGNITINNK